MNRIFIFAILAFLLAQFASSKDYDMQGNLLHAKSNWEVVSLSNESEFSTSYYTDNMSIISANGISGLYYKYPVTGHFNIECEFTNDDNTVLVLFRDDGTGKPDINNYSAIGVETVNDTVFMYATDCQNGESDVLDNTSKVEKGNYRHELSGMEYSISFKKTSKKMRISYDELSGFTHFFYSVEKDFDGVAKEGWMELFPSPPWNTNNNSFFVGIMAKDGTATFKDVKIEETATRDVSDINTGFAVTKRDFVWSGANGDAYVVTFGEEFEHQNRDYKFIFWDKMNDIPAWHMDNQLLFSYEFCETWDGGYPGCYEPMSDRFLAYSKVNVLEDNEVRKVISWNYQLRNPDYHYPYDWKGGERPKAQERYYIYPDGYIVRDIRFFQKLDTEFRNWNEVTEFIAISGTQSFVKDHVKYPVLTISDTRENKEQFLFTNKRSPEPFNSDDWDAYVISVHLKNHPDIFESFIQEPVEGKQLHFEVSWHNTDYKFAHWPVNKIHYTSSFLTELPWEGVVTHSSFAGGGSRLNQEWTKNYQIDKEGRRYRQWQALLGIASNDLLADEVTTSWGDIAEISHISIGDEFVEYSRIERAYIFNVKGDRHISFELSPKTTLINPVFKIHNFEGNLESMNLTIDGKKVHFRKAKVEQDILIWCESKISNTALVEINTL